MALSIKETVLAACQTVADSRSDVVWHKGNRAFVKAIGTDSALHIIPTAL